MSEKRRPPYLLSAALAALMLVQSILGLLFPGQYQDAEWVKAAWFGNDWVTLVVAVLLLIVAILFAARGSTRGLLLWLGVLGYATYNYAYYMFGAALNASLPLYVVALVLSVITLILCLSRIEAADVAASFRPKTPARLIGGYLIFVGTGLASVWLIMWGRTSLPANRLLSSPVHSRWLQRSIDLSIVVPLLVSGGVLLWRRDAWAYVVSAIASVLGTTYLLVLSANSLVAIGRGLAEAPGELPIWGSLAVLTIAASLLSLANVENERAGLVAENLALDTHSTCCQENHLSNHKEV
jgi:hypothetical protein